MSSDSASSPSGSPTESISPATQYSLVFYTKPENVLWCPVKFPRHFSPGVARGEKVLFRQVDDLPTQSEADTPHEAPVEVHHGTTKRMTKCSTKGATKRRIEPPEAAANDLLKWHIPVSKHKMSRTQVMEIREIMFSAQTESLSAIKRELEQEFTKVALELKYGLACEDPDMAEERFVEKAGKLNDQLASVTAALQRMEGTEMQLQEDRDDLLVEGYESDGEESTGSGDETESTVEDEDSLKSADVAPRKEDQEA